jgi:hypothetical protein
MPRTIKLSVEVVVTENEYAQQPERSAATAYAEGFVDGALRVMYDNGYDAPPPLQHLSVLHYRVASAAAD